MAEPQLCVGAVVVHAGRLLMVRRGRGPAQGTWSCPGGRVAPRETTVEAVVREGTEWFVYCEQDGRFERTSVHVEHRDQQWGGVADDGQLHVGDVVAVQGAYQIHLALKQQSGGGHDAHAGHHH